MQNVLVRRIRPKEGRKLKALSERSSHGVTRQRAHIVWSSASGMTAREISDEFEHDIKHVRLVIHAFNAEGFESLRPRYDGGPPPIFDENVRTQISDVALGSPKVYGYPFTRWSLRKLAVAAIDLRIVDSISAETVRVILREAGVTYQRTKTWKTSNDPMFDVKRRRIKRLYRNPPSDGRVMCLDEFGPLSIQPQAGTCWAGQGRPNRHPATYTRKHGVRHMFAVLDLSTNQMYYRLTKRKRRVELLQFLKVIRRTVPSREKIYLVLDNFSPHVHKSVKRWAKKNQVVLVYTPTNSSWLNRIECHFAPIREFVIRNSNYKSHEELAAALRAYIRWRNRNPRDKAIQRLQERVKVA